MSRQRGGSLQEAREVKASQSQRRAHAQQTVGVAMGHANWRISIKCAAWASLPLVPTDAARLRGGLPSKGYRDGRNKAKGQNTKPTHFCTKILVGRKSRKEVKGVKCYTVLTQLFKPCYKQSQILSQGS